MRVWPIVVGLIVSGTLAGCAPTTSLVEQGYGTSYKMAVANQILNPDGEKNFEPVVGLPNAAADKTITKYNKEFDKASQVPVYTLGVSGGMGTSSTSSGGH
jgi:hypothetical protein